MFSERMSCHLVFSRICLGIEVPDSITFNDCTHFFPLFLEDSEEDEDSDDLVSVHKLWMSGYERCSY